MMFKGYRVGEELLKGAGHPAIPGEVLLPAGVWGENACQKGL